MSNATYLEDAINDDTSEIEKEGKTWEVVYVSIVLVLAFSALISDKIGADMVMISALTMCMASNIISIDEGLAGFSNEGLLTVLALFVVAAGINNTGGLDWYMNKLLGRPRSIALAQIRLMIPIAVISAFLNNTPVVVVMIPIVQRWAENLNVSAKQLLIPLSFASILGGTCTLIGTSTNLVVYGLLETRYPNIKTMGLFDIGVYGVPIALSGMAYIILVSPILLPSNLSKSTDQSNTSESNVLLGARLTQWAPAAGRTVKRSGLRDTGGIYLVSVYRHETGNVHRAVGQDFVLNVGDILYFALGFPEHFAEFCNEHGLEVVTNEVEDNIQQIQNGEADENKSGIISTKNTQDEVLPQSEIQLLVSGPGALEKIDEDEDTFLKVDFSDIGTTKESLRLSAYPMKVRSINQLTDIIRAHDGSSSSLRNNGIHQSTFHQFNTHDPSKIIVVADDGIGTNKVVIIGLNTKDRPGLLHDISKGIVRLKLQCRSTEAAVVDQRSISIWRCEVQKGGISDEEEIWSVLNALFEVETGIEAVKQRGLVVVRAAVTPYSYLINKDAIESNFKFRYKAAIVAIIRREGQAQTPVSTPNDGQNINSMSMSKTKFLSGDILILQTQDNSPLLKKPDKSFYEKDESTMGKRKYSFHNLKALVKTSFHGSHPDLYSLGGKGGSVSSSKREDVEKGTTLVEKDIEDAFSVSSNITPDSNEYEENEVEYSSEQIQVWKDLRVAFPDDGDDDIERTSVPKIKEFLTAMEITQKSQLSNRSAIQSGLDKLSGVFLVSIERPIPLDTNDQQDDDEVSFHSIRSSTLSTISERRNQTKKESLPQDVPLLPGDILWFSGPANKIGDLRKIPGLVLYESDEIKKVNAEIHDRRLIQAVIARQGPLVGKTVVDVSFRTRYGAAVISVHREGKRVHEHPGRVKLQAGDVLLLEAGHTFLLRTADNDRAFALLSEVENSTPPRLSLLLPALSITVAMLAVFTAGFASLLVCALVASMLMVPLGILSQQEVRDAVKWDVYVTIASAFGIGTALTNSGMASSLAVFLVNIGEAIGIGFAGLYGAVYFATFSISNVVTNNAAAALVFPIAMDAADKSGASILTMSYALMLGASASFMSPFGYTTNLLIYGPGGYKTLDFIKIGTPMQLILWILSIFFLSLENSVSWYVTWISCFVFLVAVVFLRGLSKNKSKQKAT